VYKKGHSRAYISSWIKSDSRTTAAMNNKLAREQKSKNPIKLASLTKNIVNETLLEEGLSTDTPVEISKQRRILNRSNKKNKEGLELEHKYGMKEKIESYEKQGDLLQLVSEMDNDITWKSYIYNIPKGTMKFLLNASINTLPTMNNLKQWGKTSSDKCQHCNQKETTFHVLNGCKIFLEEGRYTWRHDCLVNYLYQTVKDSGIEVYADISGKTTSGGTIPADILVTAERPDLVLVDRHNKIIHIFELTVPYDTRLSIAHELKLDKYGPLCSDLVESGWKVNYYPIEVGSRGLMTQETKGALRKLLKFTEMDLKPKFFFSQVSKIITICSYKIFISRKDTAWVSPNYLSP